MLHHRNLLCVFGEIAGESFRAVAEIFFLVTAQGVREAMHAYVQAARFAVFGRRMNRRWSVIGIQL
jgi:hypothetical protein